jgi:hypothetical protein
LCPGDARSSGVCLARGCPTISGPDIVSPRAGARSVTEQDADESTLDFYPWVVFVHVAAVLGFFIAHATSRAVAFRLKREGDPERVRALLDLSGWATALPGATLAPLGFVAGIAAGFMGNWWGQA